MGVTEIVFILLSVGVVIAGVIYNKITFWQSNLPSPGLLWFRSKSGRTPDDLKDFCEKNKAGIVQAWLVAKTESWWFMSLLNAKSHALATHPDTIQAILKDEETFVKESDSFGEMGELVKESLGSLNGTEYRAMRDIMGPSFHYNYIKQFVPIFQTKTQDLFNLWKENGGLDVDVHSDMSHFTVDSLGLTAFNIDFNSIRGGSHEYIEAYNYLMRKDMDKTKDKMVQVQKDLTKMTADIVAMKDKAGTQAEKDFLDRLLTEREKLSDIQIRDNVFMMFLAGHETTAGALSWALYYMAMYPEYQKIAREEVNNVLKGALPDSENVKSLPFIDLFIKESMRIKTGSFSSRIAVKDTYVDKYFIPKGTRIGLSMYTIHHLKEFWPEPYKFDPYRFTPERSVGRHPYAYVPFSLGRRMCIGNNFSLLEQRIFLAMILQQFTIEKSDKCPQKPFAVWQGYFPMGLKLNFIPLK